MMGLETYTALNEQVTNFQGDILQSGSNRIPLNTSIWENLLLEFRL